MSDQQQLVTPAKVAAAAALDAAAPAAAPTAAPAAAMTPSSSLKLQWGPLRPNDASCAAAACPASAAPFFQMLGHWFYDGVNQRFLFDRTCAQIINVDTHHCWYPVETVVNAIDDDSAQRFWLNINSATLGQVIFERIELKDGPFAHLSFVIQGSVLKRDEQEHALYAVGYISHESSPYSEFIPRELSGDGLYLWYPESDEIICNASFHAMLGFREHDFPRTMEEYVRTMVHPDDNDVFIIQKKIAQSPQYGNYFESCQRIKHKDGRYLWMIGRGMVIERDSQGHALKIIGSRTNINLMQSNFDNIKLMMFTDSLTGLHNRNYFQQQAMRYIDPRVQPLSIIFIDVSGLKLTNDILGHSYGDYLLIKTCELITQALSEIISARPVDVKARAQRIIMNEVLTSDLNRTDPAAAPAASASQAPAPSASQLASTQLSAPSAASGTKGEEQLGKSEVMRLAGDEFLVLLPNCPLEQAQRLAQRIEELRVHNNTYHRDNSAIAVRPVPVYFGIGVATMGEAKFEQAAVSGERAPTDDDLRQLIDRADARMQASKEAHRDRDYRELKTYFEAKKGRAVSMRDDRRLKILTEEEREQLRAHRVSRIIF